MKDHPLDVRNYIGLDSSSLPASRIYSLSPSRRCNRAKIEANVPLEKNLKKLFS